MSQDQAPIEAQDHNQQEGPTTAVAWYARPWFWSALIFLALLLLLAWIFWKQWQIYQALQDAKNVEVQKQLEYNAKLEDELKRLREALAKEPCDVKLFLENEGSALLLQGGKLPKQEQVPHSANDASPPVGTATPLTKAEAPPPASATTPPTKAEAPPPAPTSEHKQAASPMAHSLEQATVLIIGDTGKDLSTGTGFFIAPGIVLTNAHVTENGKDIYVIGKFSELVTEAKLLAADSNNGRDYAVLQVPVKSVQPLNFNLNVARTQKISAWGFPGAVTDNDPNFRALLAGKAVSPPEVVYSEGSVSVVQEQNPPIIFHTAVVSHGNSGGPLVNENGEVVGINTYIALDDKSYRQSSLAIVSKDIVAFLKANNIPFTLSPKE